MKKFFLKYVKFWEYLKKIYVIFSFSIGVIFTWLGLSSLENITPFDINNINSFLIGMGTGLITTAFTVSIIQYLLDIENDEKEKSKEKEELLRAHKILQMLIFKYMKYFYCVVVPLKKRNDEYWKQGIPLITEFEFKDLCDLHLPSLYTGDDFNTSTIELFYKAERELRDCMSKIIFSNSLNYFTDIRNIMLEFIECSLGNHHEGAILGNLKSKTGDKKTTEVIYEYFNNPSIDWLSAYKERKLSSNIMLPYVALYYFLKGEIQLIVKYNNEIKKIENI